MELETTIPNILPIEGTLGAAAAPEETGFEDEAALLAMFSKKKKKKAKKPGDTAEAQEAQEGPEAQGAPLISQEEDTEDMTYDQMLSRIYQKMGAIHSASELALKRLQRPKMIAIGTKRVGWTNFEKTARTLNRTLEHLSSFIEAEFGSNVSIDGNNCLVIKGRFNGEQIESVLKKYVEQYIKCRTCLGMETKLERDAETRLYFVKCDTCRSQWSVANIQKGFHATMKGERKAARAAE